MPYGFTKKIVYQKITAYIRERKYAFKVTEIIGRESEKGQSRYINEKDKHMQNKADLSHQIPILKFIAIESMIQSAIEFFLPSGQ